MKRSPSVYILIILTTVVSIFAADNAEAAEGFATILFDLFGLGFFAVAFFYGLKIYAQYREGQLAMPWGLILAGIIFLFVGRIIQAGNEAGYWILPSILNSLINLVVAVSLALGFISYKKYIS